MSSAFELKFFLALSAFSFSGALFRELRGRRPSLLLGALLGLAGAFVLMFFDHNPWRMILVATVAAGVLEWRRHEELRLILHSPTAPEGPRAVLLAALFLYYLPYGALAAGLAREFAATFSPGGFFTLQAHVLADTAHTVVIGPLQKLHQLQLKLAAFNSRHLPAVGRAGSHLTFIIVLFAFAAQFLKGLIASYDNHPVRVADAPPCPESWGAALRLGAAGLPRAVLAGIFCSPYLFACTFFLALVLPPPGVAGAAALAALVFFLCLAAAALECAVFLLFSRKIKSRKLQARLPQLVRDWALIVISLSVYVGALRAGRAGEPRLADPLYGELCLAAYLFCLNSVVLMEKMYLPWRERMVFRVTREMLAAILHNDDARELYRLLEDRGAIDSRGFLALETIDAIACGERRLDLGGKYRIIEDDVWALLLRLRGRERTIQRELRVITAVLAVLLFFTFRDLVFSDFSRLHWIQALAAGVIVPLAGRALARGASVEEQHR